MRAAESNAGFLLVVATNQPDVGRGTQSREQVESIHASMLASLPQIDRVEVSYDPGGAGGGAPRRKPAPGMLLDAADALGITLSASFMVGDRWRDVDCGHAAGCRTVFIDRAYRETLRQTPDFTVESFAEAVEVILDAATGPVTDPARKTLVFPGVLPLLLPPHEHRTAGESSR